MYPQGVPTDRVWRALQAERRFADMRRSGSVPRGCTGGDPPAGAGHFISEMSATQWIGLSEVEGSGATDAFMEELK